MEVISSQVTAAAVVSFFIAFLKKQAWFPWLTEKTETANRVVAIVLSGLSSVGIDAKFNHGTGTLIVTGLTLVSVLSFAWHWLTQFALTHGWFKATSASDQIYVLLQQLVNQKLPPQAPTNGGTSGVPLLPAK